MGDNELDSQEQSGPTIIALVADLMFAARIRGAAPEAHIVNDSGGLSRGMGPETRLVLVDLQVPGSVEAVKEARRVAREGARIVAFGPHVETDALRDAREAGAHRVMARSAFVRELPSLVATTG